MLRRVNPATPFVCTGIFFAFAITLVRADDDAQAREALWLTDHAQLVHKVRTLKIGDVDLKDVTIPETIEFLRSRSRAFDPDHQGINFVITSAPPNLNSIRISAKIKQATVEDVLARIPLGFTIGDFVVGLRLDSGEGVYLRTFDVPDNALAINPSMLIDENKRTYDVRLLFEAKGIPFPPAASAVYSLPEKKLTVVSVDPEEMIRIDELLVYGFKNIK